tara:strand:+ start:840 stop:1082 length:243 start_codon:yes stop_codon:yes gene_type:complete
LSRWTLGWSKWGTIAPASGFLSEQEETAMTGEKEKWDGSKPKIPDDDAAGKGDREKKIGDRDQQFEGPSTDSEEAKHDGP